MRSDGPSYPESLDIDFLALLSISLPPYLKRVTTTMWFHLILLVFGKATPLLLASFGGLLSESSGVINFALEGMMLMGAFAAVWATFASGSPWLGLLAGAAGGMTIGVLHGVATLKLRANQIVSSIALNLLATGVTGMLLNQVFQVYGTSPSVKRLPDLNQVLSSAFGGAWLSSGLEGVSIVTPLALALCALVIVFFKWSAWGLRVRACGEDPQAASAAGLSVFTIRFLSVVGSGILAGLGGACLSIADLSQFVDQMTHGRGYLAIAVLILGRWRPVGVLCTALFFGMSEALSEWMAVRWAFLPHQAFLVFPYFVCFLVLMRQVSGRQPPSALGRLL